MITVAQYFIPPRDRVYANELTPTIRANAAETVARINLLIAAFTAAGIRQPINPTTGTPVSSGWRPARINAQANGAVNSKHMTGQACDLYDPDGDIDEWALAHPDVLSSIGLWQEHPASTKGWAHFQTVAPRSGNRVFYP